MDRLTLDECEGYTFRCGVQFIPHHIEGEWPHYYVVFESTDGRFTLVPVAQASQWEPRVSLSERLAAIGNVNLFEANDWLIERLGK